MLFDKMSLWERLTWTVLGIVGGVAQLIAPETGVQFAIPALALAGIGAGASLLGGLFGDDDQSSSFSQTSSTELGNLPPQLLALRNMLLAQGGGISNQLGQEGLQGLGLDQLTSPVFGGGLEQILNTSGLTPGVQQAFDEATTGSFDLARENLQRNLGFLQDQAQGQAAESVGNIRGQLGQLGLRRSTVGGEAIGRSLGDIDARLNQAIQGGQSQLGQLGVANLQQRAQGLLTAQGLSQQARLGAGQLALGERGQQIGLRAQREGTLMNLLSNPLLQQLFQRELATSTTETSGTGSQAGGGGVGGALGGLGALGIQAGLNAYAAG